MSTPVYIPDELQGKYITCFVVLSGKRPALDCVRYASGERADKPVLYDSIDEARNDRYFDPDNDEVIPASEYFERINHKKSS